VCSKTDSSIGNTAPVQPPRDMQPLPTPIPPRSEQCHPGLAHLVAIASHLATRVYNRMSELITFSFRLAPEPAQPFVPELCPRGDLDPFLPASVAAELLDGLGAKCVQVEFATHGYAEAAIDMTHKNLSRALAILFPRLTHLQLEAPGVRLPKPRDHRKFESSRDICFSGRIRQ